MDNQPVLMTKGVTKRFGDFVAVNNVDFELIEKETLGIIGPNGAGKDHLYQSPDRILHP